MLILLRIKLKFIFITDVEIDRMDLSIQLPDNEYITNTTLPECNRDATSVNDVYNIFDIVPKSKLESLYDSVTEILNGNSNNKQEYVYFEKLLSFFIIVLYTNIYIYCYYMSYYLLLLIIIYYYLFIILYVLLYTNIY